MGMSGSGIELASGDLTSSDMSGMSGLSGFESDDSMDPEAVIPTVEVPSISEDMGLVETESDAALVEVGSDESMETEAFELMDESGETDGVAAVGEVKGRAGSRRSGRMSNSARMRALEMEQKRSHAGWTIGLLLCLIMLSLQFMVLYSELLGSTHDWALQLTNPLRNMVDSIYASTN